MLSQRQSLVRLTLDQRRLDVRRGLDTSIFISGYPGSPLTMIAVDGSERRGQLIGVHQMDSEERRWGQACVLHKRLPHLIQNISDDSSYCSGSPQGAAP